MKINLLPKEIQFRKRRWLKVFFAFVMVSFLTASGLYYVWYWQNEISLLEEELVLVEAEYLVAWDELSGYKDIKGLDEDVRDRERILASLEEMHYSGHILAELSSISDREVQVREFSLNGGEFSLNGRAADLAAVAKISEELRALGVYEDVRLSINSISAEGTYPVSFGLSGYRKGGE